MLGIWLSQALDVRQLDGVASLVIAGLLASVAWLLARECQSLLTGEAASPELRRSVADVAPSRTGVLAIMEMATLHLGPELLLVTLSFGIRQWADCTGDRGCCANHRTSHPWLPSEHQTRFC